VTDMQKLKKKIGGEGGIRTPGTLARTSHFECDAIDHSATSPLGVADALLAEVRGAANPKSLPRLT
jgi:hypothetical protein